MTCTASDLSALHGAVLAAPADDLPRLVYADALEESGECERAEFVRVQVELATMGPLLFPSEPERNRFGTLRGREWELWSAHSREWFVDESIPMGMILSDYDDPPGDWLGIVRRGFIAEVRCPLGAWLGGPCGSCEGSGWVTMYIDDEPEETNCMVCGSTGRTSAHGPALVRQHPVERVMITDATVFASGGNDTYYVGGLGQFPKEYWSGLENHRTRAAALNALSAALIVWAKSQPTA